MQSLFSTTLLIIMIAMIAGSYKDPGYVCYPNGTITKDNPNATLYTRVIAAYNDGTNFHLCSVSGGEVIVITQCNITFWITVVFSDGINSQSKSVIGGKNIKAYRLKCKQITDHTKRVNNDLAVTFPVTAKRPMAPSYTISAGYFEHNTAGSPVRSASVGEIIDFIIIGPVEYYLRPLSCVAYDSPSKASATDNKPLITDGCTLDDRLISHFRRTETGSYFRYTAILSVFKFYRSSEMYIECIGMICPSAYDCLISCDADGRNRRHVVEGFGDVLPNSSGLATIGRRLQVWEAGLFRAQRDSAQKYESMGLGLLISVMVVIQTCC